MKNECSPHLLRVSLLFDERDEARLCDLLDILQKYPSKIREIAFFTSLIHVPQPLDEIKHRAEILKKHIQRFRNAGFRTGINHLSTVGHHEENLGCGLGERYTHITDRNGTPCRGAYCMNDERYLSEYVVPLYKELALTDPDFILIDDDVRYSHMPVGTGCFCKHCMEKFNRTNGTLFTRETLVKELDSRNFEIRRLWMNKQSLAIENLLRLIGNTVRNVNESITLGMMSGERWAEGYRFDRWATALSADGKYPIMWRPGGGAYTDSRFDEIVRKTEQTGRQCAYLPPYVTEIQYEIENFPYQAIKKTPTSTAIEAAWAMTSGSTGAAFNILPSESGEPMRVIEPHFKAIDRLSPLYRLLAEKTAGKRPVGVGSAWRQDSLLSVPCGDFTAASGDGYADFSREFFNFGIPEAYHPDNCLVLLGKGEFAASWSDTGIESLLSKSLYIDVDALTLLNDRGYGSLTGFAKNGTLPVDASERYTEDGLNREILGGQRNCRQAFHEGDSYDLVPLSDKVRILSKTVDYQNNILSNCSLGVFENEKGGKIAVAGYYPYIWLSDSFKSRQLLNLMLWLSDYKLPSYVESYVRLRNHTFVDGNRITVALLNPTNEPYEKVEIAVLGEKETARIYTQDGCGYTVAQTRRTGSHSIFTASEIAPFSIVIVEA